MSNLYIEEYQGVGSDHSSAIQAPRSFVQLQKVSLSSTHAETAIDFASNSTILRLHNEGTVTAFYKLGTQGALSTSPATTSDRPVLAGTVVDIYIRDDIGKGNVRLSAVTA